MNKKTKMDQIERVVDLCSLSSVIYKPINKLSKGYRQRVGMAQALIHEPEVLILDEPTSGLDPNQIRGVRETMRKLGQEKTILLSTHILQEVQAMADRVILINEGHKVFDGRLEDIDPDNKGLDHIFGGIDWTRPSIREHFSSRTPKTNSLIHCLVVITKTQRIKTPLNHSHARRLLTSIANH